MGDETAHIPRKRTAGVGDVLDLQQIHSSVPDIATVPIKKAKMGEESKEQILAARHSHLESAEGNIEPSSQTKSSSMSDDTKPSENNSSRNDSNDKDKDDRNEDTDGYDEDDGDEDGDDYGEDNDSIDDGGYDEDVEDYEDPEYEVEEHELILSSEAKQVVKLRLHVSKEEPFEMWLDNIHARCAYEGKDIAYGIGRYINRDWIRANFWGDMEEPSDDMSNLAFGIFDRYGYLLANLKEHCVRRGTGVWKSELDIGPLFLIERLEVTDREWRRKGLGRAMVNALIQKAQKNESPRTPSALDEATFSQMRDGTQGLEDYSRLNTLVLPGWLSSDVGIEKEGKSRREQCNINGRAMDSAIAFYRSVGFRRIGASNCLGFSSDPNHKSHALSIMDDFDMPRASTEDELSDGDDEDEVTLLFLGSEREEEKRLEKLERLKETHPLHHATLTITDTDCVEFYKAFAPNDGPGWQQVDRSHDTVLHVAACQFKPQSTKWLMDNVGQILMSARDKKGYTPLESLQDHLETKRTRHEYGAMTLNVSDRFSGFPPDATACLAILNGLTATDPSSIQSIRLKYGCTCGQCVGGFMSPRMKLALIFQAEVTHDQLDFDISDGPNWCDWHDDIITHVSPAIQQNFRTNKSLRQGFANVFSHIAACLNSDTVPTRENVLNAFQNGGSEWPPVTRNYLERGGTIEGKVEAAVRIIFDQAREQDEKAGDGQFEAVMKEELSKLEVCRNDHEFGFVASKCGLPEHDYF